LITLHPVDRCVESGGAVQFSADATADSTVFWQWYKDDEPLSDGGNISGTMTEVLTIDPVSAADVGSYAGVPFTLEPQPVVFCAGETDSATLSVGDCPECTAAGDGDGDGDVDLRDLHQFMLCFGEADPLPAECVCSDVNTATAEIDLGDWSMLEPLITGP
jgi:hypothetical protein